MTAGSVYRSVLLVSIVAVSACSSGGDTSNSQRSAQASSTATASTTTTDPLIVTSSITDGSALAQAVAWTATTSAPATTSRVEFLIDGVLSWTELRAPWVFNDDPGVLHPWLLGVGPHVLTVRAFTFRQDPAEATANVTVTSGAEIPVALVGTFTRMVSAEDVARTQPQRPPADKGLSLPAGVWTARFQPDGSIVLDDPNGSGITEAMRGTDDGVLSLEGSVSWRESKDRQGFFCEPEPTGQYRWSVSGSALVIDGGQQQCADRDSVFVGSWTRSQ